MTEGFDAELYLRLLGERDLLGDGERHHHDSPLQGPAAALVAAGAIDPAAAARAIEDYNAAGELRGEHHRHGPGGPRRRSRQTSDLALRRTAILDCEVSFHSGRLWLRYLTLGAARRGGSEGQLRFRWARDPLQAARSRRPFHGGGAMPTIVAEHGRTLTVAGGSGGGSDDEWTGTLELSGGLAADAAWLEIEGVRIELRDAPAAGEVVIEPLDDEPAIDRYLWRRLAVGEMPFHRTADVESSLTALLAAGVLRADDPLLARVRAVATALPDHPRHPHFAGGGGAAGGRGLPEPWRSLVRRFGRDDGRVGAWVIGAVTPRFNGVQAALLAVVSDAHGFEVEFEVTPDVLSDRDLQRPPFAWWARDDRGNHYLGGPNGWDSNDDGANGTLRFWPALDPKATRLDLMPTATTERAIVPVTLGGPGEVTP